MTEKPKRPQITITLDGPLPRVDGESYPPFSVEARNFPAMPPAELAAETSIILMVLIVAHIKQAMDPEVPTTSGLVRLIELATGIWENVGETTAIEGIDLDDLQTPAVRV